MINHHKFKFMQKKEELKSFNKDMKKTWTHKLWVE